MKKKSFRQGAAGQAAGLVDLRAEFAHALALHQAGHLTDAERRYRAILKADPRHFDATNLLGSIFLRRGQFEQAERQFRRAIEINPTIAAAFFDLGNALLELRRLDEAVRCYGKALALEPDNPNALNNRGAALLDLGRTAEAIASFDQALSADPNFARAYFNRGNALKVLNCFEDAIASYGQAIDRLPEFAEAFNNRGTALLSLAQVDAAAADFQNAIRINPSYAEAHCNLAAALIDLRNFQRAFAASSKAVELDPTLASAWIAHGDVLRNLRRANEALAAFDKAVTLNSRAADAWIGRARALKDLRRHDDAAACYSKLLDIDPDYEFAKGDLLYEKMRSCDWSNLSSLIENIRKDIAAGKKAAVPFCLQPVTNSSQESKRCAEIYCAAKFPSPAEAWRGGRYDNDKIRVGYLSGELHAHVVARLIVELFERHDRTRFELFAFDSGADDGSETRRRIYAAFDKIIDVSQMEGSRAAAAVKDNKIEILIDLNGHSGQTRLDILSHRPAPVQVNYLGFSGTSGADFIDYIMADRHIVPAGCEAAYTEQIVYLPDNFQPGDSRRVIADNGLSRAGIGLPERGFVFCSFNNSFKITPDMFDVWMRLLKQVADAVLWLPFESDSVVSNLREEAAARGIEPERLIFSRRTEQIADYFARYRLADIFLDTFPFNAGATANDALWAGLPLLTRSGEVFTARIAGSLLQALGLPELITNSAGEYEALALKLAGDRALLASIRQKLLENRTRMPLFDTERLTRHIEAAYVRMRERYRAGLAPESFAVERIA